MLTFGTVAGIVCTVLFDRILPLVTMFLETDRFVIRPFDLADVIAYSEIVADPDVMRLLTGKPESLDEAKKYVEECIASESVNGFSRYAVFLKRTDELIGFCGFKLIDGEIDFGWRYAKKHWNNGYGTEAAGVVKNYGLEILRVPVVVAVALPENIGSIRIMEKIGMKREGFGDWDGKQTIRFTLRSEMHQQRNG